jgi:hypothetical protein
LIHERYEHPWRRWVDGEVARNRADPQNALDLVRNPGIQPRGQQQLHRKRRGHNHAEHNDLDNNDEVDAGDNCRWALRLKKFVQRAAQRNDSKDRGIHLQPRAARRVTTITHDNALR